MSGRWRRRAAWAASTLLAALLVGGIVYRQKAGLELAPLKALKPGPMPAPSAAARAVTATSKAPAPITPIDPRFEVCKHPEWDSEALAESKVSAEMTAYLQRQYQDLHDAAGKALLQPGSSDAQRVAGHLLKGDPAAAARIAAETEDGQAYGFAWQTCQKHAESAFCAALNLERWAQLEPDNATPWLGLLAVAQRNGDRAQAVSAMHRTGLAREIDGGWGWLVKQVSDALPAELPEAGQLALLTDLVGRQAAMVALEYQALTHYCRADALGDANVRQQCEAVALLLMKRPRTLMDAGIGVRIGERLGLPAERMPVTPAQLNAASRWITEDLTTGAQRPLCEGTRRMIAYMQASARLGEWTALQAGMKSQPLIQPLSRP